MRKALSYGLLLVVLLGSVGLPLYKHTCLHDNITIKTLFTSSDHCSPEHEKEELAHHQKPSADGHGCCAPAVKEAAKDGCCSESMSLLSVSFNFFEQIQYSAFLAPEALKNADLYLRFIPATGVEKHVLYSANTDPPKPGGKEILKQNCIWRI